MEKKLTFASLNTLGLPFQASSIPKRYQAIASYVNQSDVDVLQLQEIISYAHLGWIRRHLSSFPYCHYRKSYLGPKGGLVTFSRIPIEIVGYRSFKKNFYLFDRSLIEALILKGMLVTKLANQNLYFMNTHFATTHDADWTEDGKYFQIMESNVREFHDFMRYLISHNSKANIIAAGDFNISKKSLLYKMLTNFPYLSDVFRTRSGATYQKAFLHGIDPYCIDYIFLYGKENASVLQRKYFFTDKVLIGDRHDFASDHVGLQITSLIQ